MKKYRQIKKFSIQVHDSDCSVCMVAICYSGMISTFLRNEQLLSEERRGVKFEIESLRTQGLVRVYADGRTDEHGKINSAHQSDHLCIYKVRSKVSRTFKKKIEQMVLSAKSISINFIQNSLLLL